MAAAGPAAPVARAGWITPREQIERLRVLLVDEICNAALEVRNVASIIADYAASNLSANLINWHTALERLNMLPDRLPPLPENIHQVLSERCPIRGDETKSDGSRYTVGETHSLYLIPAGTVNELKARMSAYGEEHLAEYGGQNPLQFSYFWDRACREHGDTRSDEPQWVLISNDVLSGSRNRPYSEQVRMVVELSQRSFVQYEVPSLKAAVMFAFLHKVATGESVLQAGNDQNGGRYTYTRVQETARETLLAVGAFAPGGLVVDGNDFDDDVIGVGVLRKF